MHVTGSAATEQAEPASDLPGVGPKLLAKAVRAFGSEAAFRAAIAAGEVDRIARVPGIGEQRAAALVHALRGTETPTLFGTSRVEELFAQVRDRIAANACTRPGRNHLRLLAPLPTHQERDQRLDWVMAARDEAATVDLPLVRKHLARIAPVPESRPAYESAVVVFVDTPEDRETLLTAGIDRWAAVASARDIETAQAAEAGVYAYSEGGAAIEDADHILPVPFTKDPAVLVPWAVTERFRAARPALEAAAALSEIRGRKSPAQDALAALDRLPAPANDLDAGDIEAAAQVALEEAMRSAEERLAQITLTAADLMRAMASEPPAAVRQVYADAVKDARTRLRAATGLDVEAFTDTLPAKVDAEAIEGALEATRRLGARERLARQQEVAKALARLEAAVATEREDHEAFDARQAIGGFVLEHDLVRPTWGDGLAFEGLLHFDLSPHGDRVAYRLGLDAGGTGEQVRIALLTGANSGGKTTLLEAIAQNVALAHAGLPVAATRAVVPAVDAVHVFAHKRSLGAGAFESFLRRLFPVAEAEGRVLVLADELEAMTELEAAAEIIAAFLERLAERGAFAVVATHMAPHVLPSLHEAARACVRVDGIEARGLSEDGALIVDRSPRLDHLARSTPELILRRLAGHGPAELRDVFAALAERVRRRG